MNYKFEKYYIYYDLADEDNLRRIITHYGKLDTINKYDNEYDDYNYNGIQLKFVDEDPSDDVLIEYVKNFEIWKKEAMNNGIYSIDITQGDVQASQQFFFSTVLEYKDKKTKKLLHDKITAKEYIFFENCANNAVFYLKEDGIELECCSYDRKMAYANIMGSKMKIPTKKGKEYTLSELPTIDRLEFGFYRVKITYTNKDFLKCFVLSKTHTYVDISLKFAMEIQKQFGLTIELIQDDKPNAYIYDEYDMMPICMMTTNWLRIVKQLKAKYPNNPYIKQMTRGTWGMINQRNTLEYTADEINEKELDFGLLDENKYIKVGQFEKNDVMYYKMVNTSSAYRYQIRLKPWITAQSRNDIGRLALKHLKHVVRIQTDSVSFDKEIDIKDNDYVKEKKTTGLIHWKNVNCYHNKTTGYKSKQYDKY